MRVNDIDFVSVSMVIRLAFRIVPTMW